MGRSDEADDEVLPPELVFQFAVEGGQMNSASGTEEDSLSFDQGERYTNRVVEGPTHVYRPTLEKEGVRAAHRANNNGHPTLPLEGD